METADNTKNALLDAFMALPPVLRRLIQICAIIDEPTNVTTLFNVWRRSRCFPEVTMTNLQHLKPYIESLAHAGLLDEQYQVPNTVKEIIVRSATKEGLITRGDNLLAGLDAVDQWYNNSSRAIPCVSCSTKEADALLTTPVGPLCAQCVLSEIRMELEHTTSISPTAESMAAALGPEGTFLKRFHAIWSFHLWNGDYRGYEDPDLKPLLVDNLSFSSAHPLAAAVRDVALNSVIDMRYGCLNTLLLTKDKEPWRTNVNVITALLEIAPDKTEVSSFMQKAASDPILETRRHLIAELKTLPHGWAAEILKQMTVGDPDPKTQTMAKDALAAVVARKKAFVERPRPWRSSVKISGSPSIRFGLLVREIKRELPVNTGWRSRALDVCPRIMRDLRIAVHGGDLHLYYKNIHSLHETCGDKEQYASPLLQFCDNPFDDEWFSALSENIRMEIMIVFFHQALLYLRPDTDLLTSVMKAPLFKQATSTMRSTALYYLTLRLVLGGRAAEAIPVVSEFSRFGYTYGLSGLHHFVKGRIDEATASYNADLAILRNHTGKKKSCFDGIEGVFHVLALLTSDDSKNLKKAEQLIDIALAPPPGASYRLSPYTSLKGVLKMRRFELEIARALVAQEEAPIASFDALINAISSFWINGQLSPITLTRLHTIHVRAAYMGLDWVAMEAAALLVRTGNETPEQRDFLERTEKQTGMHSFAMTLKAEEPWRKNLNALMQLGDVHQTSCAQKKPGETRLIWMVSKTGDTVNVRPVEQKMTAKGAWSSGRNVALSRAFEKHNLDFATPDDISILATLRRYQQYYEVQYIFDKNLLLPALVGHPRLFLEENPDVKVEFVKGEPEIIVAKANGKLHIKPSTPFPESDVMLLQETPARWKVIKINSEQRLIAGILGRDGLTVPESASKDVMTAIAAISSCVLVHSDIGGSGENLEEIASDPTPHVYLLPVGAGFTAEIFVMPFKEDGGPCLKPGKGAVNIIAEFKGKKVQTKRDLRAEETMARRIGKSSTTFARLSDAENKAFIDDPEECLQILLDLKALQEAKNVIVEWPEGEKLKVTHEISARNLQLRIAGGRDWFELSGNLRVDDNLTIDMKRMLDLLKTSRRRFIPLEDGAFLALTAEFRKRLDEIDIYTERKGKELHLHPLAALAMQDLEEAFPDLTVDASWKKRIKRIQTAQETHAAVPALLQAELRDYQEEGYLWLARLSEMGIGACLADDMGLGKTIQALTLLLHRASMGPSLVIAPTSVCWNWGVEAERFTPTLNVIQFAGGNRKELVEGLKSGDVLVVSYGLLVQEEELLTSIDWNVVILDEAQAIKNVLTKRFQAAVKLKGAFRMTTTGTPIQNHLDELWALFSFINPGLLGAQEKFNARFAVPIEKYNDRDARTRLKKLIQPFILRRLKSQVLDELPPRTEIVLQVEMSQEEAAFYEALRRQAIENIEADSAPIYMKHLKILAEITRLRQAACHPRLVAPETELGSSKLSLFGEVVEELIENRHKALVFSQFVRHLDLIREYLDNKKIRYRYLDGSTPPKERKMEVDAFQAGEGDLFLISLKAGGLGLNLTAADYVIHMDPWWNPSVEDQASDRAHRYGQQRPVTIYRLVAKDTIEEKIVKLHQEKRELAGSILDGTDITGKITAEELIKLIREA